VFAITQEEIVFLLEEVSPSPTPQRFQVALSQFQFLNAGLIPFVVTLVRETPELAGPMASTLAQIMNFVAFFDFLVDFFWDNEELAGNEPLFFFIFQIYGDVMQALFASLSAQLPQLLPRVDFDGVCIPVGLFLDFGEHAENVTVTGGETIGTVAPVRREVRA
jgi:hypothetical protein